MSDYMKCYLSQGRGTCKGVAVLWFVLFILTPNASQAQQFSMVSAGLRGAGHGAVAWADYDTDGDLDIIVAGQEGDGVVTGLYENRDGAFFRNFNTPFVDVARGDVAWADIDNDNDPDVLITGERSNGTATTQLYRNDSGTFVDMNAGIVALKESMAAWADADGDGDQDLYISGVGDDAITVSWMYFNDGNGVFEQVNPNTRGLRLGSLEWYDYDVDGDPDLLVTGRDTQNKRWTILYDNLKGRLIDSGHSLPQIDLSAATWGEPSFRFDQHVSTQLFITGTSDGGILSRVYEAPNTLQNPNNAITEITTDIEALEFAAAAWGDFNNDRVAEIAMMGRNPNQLELTLIYNQEGAYMDTGEPLRGLYRGDMAWGDFNNDGRLDLLVAGFTDGDIPAADLYRNNVAQLKAPPDAPINLWTEKSGSTTLLRWGDALNTTALGNAYFNVRVGTSPGASDVVSPLAASNGYRYLPLPGNAYGSHEMDLHDLPPGTYYWSVQTIDLAYQSSEFAPEQVFTILDESNRYVPFDPGITMNTPRAFWADLDADGDLDIVTDHDLYRNQNGSFVAMNAGVKDARHVADIDADGDLDILAYSDGEEIALYRNDQGQYTNVGAPFINAFNEFTAGVQDPMRFGDFDNDGDEDILVVVDNGAETGIAGTTSLFINEDGQYSDTYTIVGPTLELGSPVIADYDNNGYLDYFQVGLDNTGYQGNSTSLYRNEGGLFEVVSDNIAGALNGRPVWGDYDTDGDMDLMTSGSVFGTTFPAGLSAFHTQLYRNDGGNLNLVREIRSKVHGYPAWGDYDNDGDPDLLLTGRAVGEAARLDRASPLYENRVGVLTNIAEEMTGLFNMQAVWGDYDNDGDLDALIAATDAADNPLSRIYVNPQETPNARPQPPTQFSATMRTDGAVLSWSGASDNETPAASLTYNLHITTENRSKTIKAPHALPDGRLLTPAPGKVGHVTEWTINGLAPGAYYWRVQSVDAGFAGSAFSAEQVFIVDDLIPVELSSFEAYLDNGVVVLQWDTASEINNAGFEVQRAVDDGIFERIAFVKGAGTSTEARTYKHEDASLPFDARRVGYRLKQIDFNGQFEYSEVRWLETTPPEEVTLWANYPNPFNPVTEIRYEVPATMEVRLTVYDITGKVVDVLVDKTQPAGTYAVSFDATGLASGMYLYRLETAASVTMRPMVLLK